MPPNELDNLKHIRNQLLERRRTLQAQHQEEIKRIQAEMRQLEEYAKSLGDLEEALPALLSGKPLPEPTVTPKIPITEIIDRYLAEGHQECTAATIKHYASAHGYTVTTATYNSIHEALRRRVEKGAMVKDGTKFKVRENENGN
jgi:hypothetical protein